MAEFDYLCEPCELIWTRDFEPGKAKSKIKCKDCGKFCERYFGDMKVNLSFGNDVDFHSVRSRARRNRIKTSESDGRRFQEEAIEGSKKRLLQGGEAYARYTMNHEVLEKEGQIVRLTEKQKDDQKRDTGHIVTNARKRAWKK